MDVEQATRSIPLHTSVFTRPHARAKGRGLLFDAALVAAPAATFFSLRDKSPRIAALTASGAAALLIAWRAQFSRWFTEEPAYAVLWQENGLVLREYDAQIQASTTVVAPDFSFALRVGFRRLAAYIFGANHREEKLSMTAPVVATPEQLPMLEPLLASPSHGGNYDVAFVMPPGRTLDSLPQPSDSRVALRELSARRVAVHRFSGRFSRQNIERHVRVFRQLARDAGLTLHTEPVFAGFDSPMTLPIFRRNEIWAEVPVD